MAIVFTIDYLHYEKMIDAIYLNSKKNGYEGSRKDFGKLAKLNPNWKTYVEKMYDALSGKMEEEKQNGINTNSENGLTKRYPTGKLAKFRK